MSQATSRKKIDISARKIAAGWPKVGYNGENDEVRDFYVRAAGKIKDRTSMFEHKKLADIFIFAMALGKKEGIRKPYPKKSDRRDTIDMEYIAVQPEYLWMMIAVAIEESNGDLEIFQDPREKIINVCEEYANYGIELLIDMEKQASTSEPFLGYERKFEELLEKLSG